ncbi:MAG: hypothetical protein WA118_09700 [Carboxydocellales bacterium]
MQAKEAYSFVVIPLYEQSETLNSAPGRARATGHALVQRRGGSPSGISLYFPGEIYSGEPEIAIIAPRELTGLALNLNPNQANTKALKRYTGFLPSVGGEFKGSPAGSWKLQVNARKGEMLLEGNFNFSDVFGPAVLTQQQPEALELEDSVTATVTEVPVTNSTPVTGSTPVPIVAEFRNRLFLPGELLPLQPIQPLANPLSNHLWWTIRAWERFL